jgi:D-3-phosphoglycerate dehydrogenase
MKDGVRIVNCTRGGVIDEEAFLEAMEPGNVAGAGLEVIALSTWGRSRRTTPTRNGGLAGVLNRFLSQQVNVVNAMQIATQGGLEVAERHEKRAAHTDSVDVVDGIYCQTPLSGHLTFMKNRDVPGVTGHVGTVLGKRGINIANFSLGRQESPAPGETPLAIAVVETDEVAPEDVLAELCRMPAVLLARRVEFE